MVKNPPANAGDIRDAGSIAGLERSPGEGNGNSLWYACPENSMDGGAWKAIQSMGSQRVGQDGANEHAHKMCHLYLSVSGY